MFATWIWAVCANLCGRCKLNSCAFNCLNKQTLIIRANVWRLVDALTEANYSFQQGVQYSLTVHYAIHFTNHVRQSQAFESFWVKSSNWSKLTKHRTTVRSEVVVGKSVRSGNLCANVICPNVWRHTQKKLVRLSAD